MSQMLFLEAQPCPHAAKGAQLQETSSRKAEQSDAPHWAHPARLPKAAAQLLLAAGTGWEAA